MPARMKLFQYWDGPQPPADVAELIAGFRDRNPELEHHLFDEAAAAEFIATHFGAREHAAFRSLAVPAMQSDYFRLCALHQHGGVYVDADFESRAPLVGLLDRAPHGLVLMLFNEIVNGLLLVRRPRDPFIGACLKLATDNIAERRFYDPARARLQDIRLTAGLGPLNAIGALIDEVCPDPSTTELPEELVRRWDAPELLAFARESIEVTPELVGSFRSLTRLHVLETVRWMGDPDPAYKATERHWPRWKTSIYRD